MKNKKQQQELEKIRQDQNQQQFSAYKPQSEKAPLEQLQQQLGQLEQSIRVQQYETETNIQESFNQAANGLGDSQAVNQLTQATSALAQLVQSQGLQGSAQQYNQLLSEIENQLRQQIQSGTQQVVQNLQQGIVALAQANAALLDSQNYNQMLQYVNQSRLLLINWEAGGTQIH